ncbi:hypothetical protein F4782DRAFT_522450 [Xylaria castorea]|nr:hypothetical protein F4782DRAFT_522450 [Xylaria castorea]
MCSVVLGVLCCIVYGTSSAAFKRVLVGIALLCILFFLFSLSLVPLFLARLNAFSNFFTLFSNDHMMTDQHVAGHHGR